MSTAHPSAPEAHPSSSSTATQAREDLRVPAAVANARATRRWFLRGYVRPHVKRLAFVFVLLAAGSATGVWMLHILETILDTFLLIGLTRQGITILAIFFFAGILQALFQTASALAMPHLLQKISTNLKDDIFRHLVRLDYGYFLAENPGRVVSYLVQDADQVQGLVRTLTLGLGRNLTLAIGILIFMLWKDWLLTIIVLFATPFIHLSTRNFARRARRLAGRAQEERAELLRYFQEVVYGIRNVKAAAEEHRETQRAHVRLHNLRRTLFRSDRVQATLTPILELATLSGLVACFAYGAWQIERGNSSTGEITTFFISMLVIGTPIKQLARAQVSMQVGLAALQRIYGLMIVSPAVRERDDARVLEPGDGLEVQFEDVSFSYQRDGGHALRSVSCTVPAGSTAAFVGASGAGKTTVFNLLLRFWDPNQGRVLVGGQDVRELTFISLRQNLAVVSQETDLFDTSVRENLLYGVRRQVSDEEIEAAARAGAAHGFISDLEHGYDTLIGSRGVRLSGGQRQRLALTRALLQNAPLLLLDEATSALDAENESFVQRTMQQRKPGQTVILIAHRLATVRHADRIFLLENGCIRESGTHESLLERDGRYARLVRLQTSPLSPFTPLAFTRGREGEGEAKEEQGEDGDQETPSVESEQ